MAVVKMKKMTVAALKENRKAILEAVQKTGLMNVIPGKEEEGCIRMDTLEAQQRYERHGNMAADAVDILNRYEPEKKPFFESLNGKTRVKESELQRIADEHVDILNKSRSILRLEREIGDLKSDIVKYETRMETMRPWLNFDLPLNFKGTKTVSVFTGTIHGSFDEAGIKALISEKAPDISYYEVDVISSLYDSTNISVTVLKEEAEELEGVLRENGFAEVSFSDSRTPAERIQRLEKRIEKAQQDIAEKEEEIKTYIPYRQDLRMLYDYYQIRKEKYHYLGELNQTDNVFFIEGFVPEDKAPKLAKMLESKYDAFTEITEPSEDDDVPVLLKNNSFSESAEGILESFGLPHKGEMDPTFFMSIFYVILFGIMLSDAAYGIIVSLACFIVLKKCPNMEKGMRRLLKLFFFCGLSTLFWGVLFGGYFGDAITVVAKTFFNKDIVIPPLWFAPLDDPMRMLIWSLAFGVIHLLFGLGLKGYTLLKGKDVTGFIFDVVCWFMMVIGLILMLLPSEMFASLLGKQLVFPAWLNTGAKVITLVGAFGILIMAGRSSKNIGVRLGKGAYELYGITSWLSDILSYSRLLALGLATGVMGSVFNQMGSMFGGGVIGGILFIIVFLIGHVFNLAINMLGAYVHTSRLQYVEFFGKFYEGGGTPFVPFDRETKYVEFKEEN